MVNPGIYQGRRLAFMNGEKEAYANAVQNGTKDEFLGMLYVRYFKRFPVDLDHNVEPTEAHLAAVDDDAPDPEPLAPNENDMSEDDFRVAEAKWNKRCHDLEFRKGQMKRWMAHQYSKDRGELAEKQIEIGSPLSILKARLTGTDSVKPRKEIAFNAWGKEHKDIVDRAFEKEKGPQSKKKRRPDINAVRNTTRDLFKNLPRGERAKWEKLVEDAHKKRVKEWEELVSGPAATDPESRQECIDGITGVLQPILDLVHEHTGMVVMTLLGGPEPANAGCLNIVSLHSGTIKGSTKLNFGQAEREGYKEFVVPVFSKFIRKCYSKEERRALSLSSPKRSLGDLLADDDRITFDSVDWDSPSPLNSNSLRAGSSASRKGGNSLETPEKEVSPVSPPQPPSAAPEPPYGGSRTPSLSAPSPPRHSSEAPSNPPSPLSPRFARNVSKSSHVDSHLGHPSALRADCPPRFGPPSRKRLLKPSTAVPSQAQPVGDVPTLTPQAIVCGSAKQQLKPSASTTWPEKVANVSPQAIVRTSTGTSGTKRRHDRAADDTAGGDGSNQRQKRLRRSSGLASDVSQKGRKETSEPARGQRSKEKGTQPVLKIGGTKRKENKAPDAEPTSKRLRAGTLDSSDQAPPPLNRPGRDFISNAHSTSSAPTPPVSAPTLPVDPVSAPASHSVVDAARGFPADAPSWAVNVQEMFLKADLGPGWAKLVDLYTRFELRHNFVGEKKLPPNHRPSAVAAWIQRARNPAFRPTISPDVYRNQFWAWWILLQPEWRSLEMDASPRVVGGSWDALKLGGPNGFLNVPAALYFWGVGLGNARGSTTSWNVAVDDVAWVLGQILL